MLRTFYPLSWHVSDSEIQVFGWTREEKEQVYTCLRIVDFTPYMYVKLPTAVKWTNDKYKLVKMELEKRTAGIEVKLISPVKLRGIYHNIYDAPSTYIFMSFANDRDRHIMKKRLDRQLQVIGIGSLSLKCYEYNASPILQLICTRKISSSDWFSFIGDLNTVETLSTCKREYIVPNKSLRPIDDKLEIPNPLIMGYDIETYSHNPNKLCDAKHPEDIIFQISLVFAIQGSPAETWERYILSLGEPNKSDCGDVNVISCETEKLLLMEYVRLILEKNPQILIGYNTFGFDNRYMLERARLLLIYDEFVRQGCTFERVESHESNWSSSARPEQRNFFLDIKGRVHMDLMILIMSNYKLSNYKLNTVAQHFLKRGKDPLTHYDINDFCRIGLTTKGPSKELGIVGRYCVKDSELVIELFEYLQFWYSLTSMAKICYTPISYLFQRGQQIKVFSQVYKYCYDHTIVVENNSYQPQEEYLVQGAFVLDAVKGLHENCVSFDFASLYPSVIIANNICYSTFVKPNNQNVDKSKCKTIEWDEHFGCLCPNAEPVKKVKGKKHIVCTRRSFSWIQEPKGIIPSIIIHLLDARRAVKKQMLTLSKASKDYMIADQLQNAFKISANSMYGILASTMGPLIFPFAGMSVTAFGRESLLKAKSIIETQHQGKVIYGDTDSTYVKFSHIPRSDLESYCLKVSNLISAAFPSPMKLEYEDKIYSVLFLLTKKRYAFITKDKKGKDVLDYKGILLKRRDSCEIIREIYRKLILLFLQRSSMDEIQDELFIQLAIISSGCSTPLSYAITRSVKNIDDMKLQAKNETKMQFGSYVVNKLSDDPIKRMGQVKRKQVAEEDFYFKSLPAHVQLAHRMRERGQMIQSGARFAMIYTKRGGLKAAGYIKLEELEYFETFYHKSFIDTIHYVDLLLKPVAELFEACFGGNMNLFFKTLLKTCHRKAMLIEDLRNQLETIRFEEENQDHSLHKYFKAETSLINHVED